MLRCARAVSEPAVIFEQLDFLYIPSTDVAADASYFTEVLGGRLIFAIDADGTRAAMIEMTDAPPRLIFTDHLEGERPIYIYRVANLRKALSALTKRGWTREETFEIPQGPCCSFASPSGQRVALYQLTRTDAESHFAGRRDF